MANIGYINKTDEGGLVGKIDTLAFSNVIGLRRIISDNPKSPKFEVMALTAAKSWVKIGALFEQSIKSSGESFFQGRIDDPSMTTPMDIALWHDREGGFVVLWSRRRPRRDLPAAQTESDLPPIGTGSDDGLGESTAPDAPTSSKGKGASAKAGETADKATA